VMVDLRCDVLVKWHSRDFFLLAIYVLFFVTIKYPVKLVLLPPFSGGEIQHICQLGDFFEMSFQTKITFLILQAIKKTSYRSHALIFMYFYVLQPNQTFFTS
jgi:hypothetical protein